MDGHLARYDMRHDDDGWAVYDVFTGAVVVERGVPLIGMDIEEADDMVDLLNRRYAATRAGDAD